MSQQRHSTKGWTDHLAEQWAGRSYFDHFAYGSNMSSDRLRVRCPSAVVVASGYVVGRQLRFHKVGNDGTAKADAFWTGNPDDVMHGVIYRSLLTDRNELDACESLGVGYAEVAVDVFADGNSHPYRTFLYQAIASKIRTGLPTADWYGAHVVRGAAEHRLPDAYQRHVADLLSRCIG